MKKNKKLLMGILTAALLGALTVPAYAKTEEEKIGSVSLEFKVDAPKIEEAIPETIDVITSTKGISIKDAYFTNHDDEWERGDDPIIKVVIEAEKGYYFGSYKLSRISGLSDVKSKSIKKDGDKYNALVTIKLDEVEGDFESPECLEWNDTTAEWEGIEDVSYYSVRLLRNGKSVVTVSTDDEAFDFYPWMTKKGDYTFKVKAKAEKSSNDSEWSEESDVLEISTHEIYTGTKPTSTDYREETPSSSDNKYSSSKGPGYSNSPSAYNGWKKDTTGWKFYQNGAQVKYSWVRDGVNWYYIGTDGYMKTGWQLVKGTWYYMNPNGGAMATGWLNLNNVWYYLNPASGSVEGAMLTGYQTIGGYPYYFTESGALLMNGKAPNGKIAGANGILR